MRLRHIYDIHKLLEIVKLDSNLAELFRMVYSERERYQVCLSAKSDIDLKKVLMEITERDIYKSDYNKITKLLIFENVDYDEAMKSLQKIINFIK